MDTPPSLGPGELGSTEKQLKNTATVRWVAREKVFRFVSNEASSSNSSFALLGRERDWTLFL